MSDKDFKRGEVAADVKNIKREVVEIKVAMKDHNDSDKVEFGQLNDKVDDVLEASRKAANLAKQALTDTQQQKEVNDNRHAENQASLKAIATNIKTIADNQQSQAIIIAKYSGMVLVISGIGGYTIPLVIHYFFK